MAGIKPKAIQQIHHTKKLTIFDLNLGFLMAKIAINGNKSRTLNLNEAPIPIGTDGTQLGEIRKILQDADNSILNQNIRIN